MELFFTLADIEAAASRFLVETKGRTVFALHGEMGAGKTTFVHALCHVMGVKDTVSSPTFSIINEYKTGAGARLYHMDLYRISDENEAITAGVEDCLYSGDTCLVEWPEKAPGIFPPDTVHVSITAIDTNTRKLQINL